MPDLTCHDGDLNGYGCISSQFVDALFSTEAIIQPDNTVVVVGNPQWFGKITRFRFELTRHDNARVSHDVLWQAIANKQITSSTLRKVTYTVDPSDPNIAYAEGELDITAQAGSPVPSSQPDTPYKFKHTLLRVWRITETKLRY